MLNSENGFEVLRVGDIIFVRISYAEGGVWVEVERDGEMLFWGRETQVCIKRSQTKFLKGIMCRGEILWALRLMISAFNLSHLVQHELDEERKKAGWLFAVSCA